MTQMPPKDQPNPLVLSDFGFDVPTDQIAQHPLSQRDASKLLTWNGHSIAHDMVKNLGAVVPKDSLFIVNNSRVIASRIHGLLPTGGQIELLLLEPSATDKKDRESWTCLGKPMRKLKSGVEIRFAAGLSGVVRKVDQPVGEGPEPFIVEFNLTSENLLSWLDRHGEVPLPPYISRKTTEKEIRERDRESYQTVYAEGAGSVAAPTAGLHFNDELMARLKDRGCEFRHVTLHIGAGTFLPVKTENPEHHSMHSERFLVPRPTFDSIMAAKEQGRKIIVVGTTALRSLEGLAKLSQQRSTPMEHLLDSWLRTDIFIRPKYSSDRYSSWAADYLMTNFHQPQSTLFMLICALVGFENAHKIYAQAISSGYRLFSYGDSSLLKLK